jgi:glycosyltransferase involved in cell wall biosynthesis
MQPAKYNIISLHWGFIPGGGATYTSLLRNIGKFAPLNIRCLCLNAPGWPLAVDILKHMEMDLIKIKGRLDPEWIIKTRNFLKMAQADLILTHGINGAFVAALAGYGLGFPIVSSWHGEYFPSTSAQRLRKPFFDIGHKVLFRRLVKEIVTVSDFSKETLINKGIEKERITVIHNGIPEIFNDRRERLEIRKKLDISQDILLVGTACRLAAEKGLQELLKASAKVLNIYPNMRIIIWGDGPMKQSLMDLAKDLDIEKFVHLPGYQPNISQLLPALDIFITSSLFENFSLALLEAMRAGLAIVATNVGGNPEAIQNGVHGILVPYGDPQALADAILLLGQDESLRARLAAKARQRYRDEFTAEKMVSRTAEWLMNCARKYAGQV